MKLDVDNSDIGFITTGGRDSATGDQPVFVQAVREGSNANKQNIRLVSQRTRQYKAALIEFGLIYALILQSRRYNYIHQRSVDERP